LEKFKGNEGIIRFLRTNFGQIRTKDLSRNFLRHERGKIKDEQQMGFAENENEVSNR